MTQFVMGYTCDSIDKPVLCLQYTLQALLFTGYVQYNATADSKEVAAKVLLPDKCN